MNTFIGLQAQLFVRARSGAIAEHSDEWRSEQLRNADMLPPEAAALIAGVSLATLLEWQTLKQVLALPVRTDEYRYPAWQFDPSLVAQGLRPLIKQLLDYVCDWTAYRLLITKHTMLNERSLLEVVGNGQRDLARQYVDFQCSDYDTTCET